MPTYERALNLVQAFNFKKDVQTPFGFVTAMTVGGVMLTPEMMLTAPPIANTNANTNTKPNSGSDGTGPIESAAGQPCVGVLRNIKWDLGDTDPITFSGNLGVLGKQMIMGLLYATMIDSSVTLSWCVYEYDPLTRSYYLAFSDTKEGSVATSMGGKGNPQALIKKDSENLLLSVKPDPSTDVQSPENYEFELTVVPFPDPKLLYMASASTRKITKFWGRKGTQTG